LSLGNLYVSYNWSQRGKLNNGVTQLRSLKKFQDTMAISHRRSASDRLGLQASSKANVRDPAIRKSEANVGVSLGNLEDGTSLVQHRIYQQ
jgi:hypothetical protein